MQALADSYGGWLDEKSIDSFSRYAEVTTHASHSHKTVQYSLTRPRRLSARQLEALFTDLILHDRRLVCRCAS